MRSLFRLSLRNKILILTIALVIVIAGSVLFIVSGQVQRQTMEKIQQDFTLTYQNFERFLELRNARLAESCLLISELPVLKAQLSTKDAATIKDYVLNREESPIRIIEVDIFTLTDDQGVVLFRLDRPEKFGDTLASLPFIQRALEGKDPGGSAITTWIIDEKLYQVVTVPVFQRYVIGTLTLGNRITQKEAEALKRDTKSDITFVLGNRVVASTHPDVAQVDLLRSYLVDREFVDQEVFGGNNVQKEVNLDGEVFLCAFLPVSQASSALYVVAISLDKALSSLKELEQIIFLVGLIALGFALVSGYFVARGITAPLHKLVEATERIRVGDYDFQLSLTSRDEIGSLARSFNDMVLGLKERFLMSKFISSSTVEMIRQDKGGLQLGGERRNVTVFFSDIRGFTAYSERVEPEQVFEVLNKYLSVQARLVIQHNGIVDKFVGDELVAIFEGTEMVDNAVLCALEIQNEIRKLNETNPERIEVGIGINTGMAIVGNVGSEDRMDHTVLGSNMNLGARLCSIASEGQVIVSESSRQLLKSKRVKVNQLKPVTVKGISRPVQTYEVLQSDAPQE